MDFTLLKNGKTAFFRSDAEQAEWTEHEMSLFCTFPYLTGKTIERGMTVLFQAPATGEWQAYEIRNCGTYIAEGYQQFTAEDIVISELSDCHIPETIELTQVTPQAALNRVLTGTGWSVGNVGYNGLSTADIGRGSVWEAVVTIRNNWNVNLVSRVTVNANGITGRYIDILPTTGTDRGLYLSIDKNSSDPCVTYDDSELYTALYAYGASYTEGETPEEQRTVETSIAGVAWGKTADHPAKPGGQKFLEWPEKTALYGRNGKPRYGYYQNTNIKDPNVLLQKTWETLKICSDPKISITGTVTDLKRMGYNDVPLRLYDMAIVDYGEIRFHKQIIALVTNLLDPTGNTPTIGDYIPNIIYINRETENYATGGSTGAGGRGGGGSRSQKELGEFETSILQNERNIILEARQVNENREKLRAAGIEIDPITGVVIYAEDVVNGIGANFRVMNNAISSEVTNRQNADREMSSRITQTANNISLEVSERKSEDNKLSGRINVAARQISLVVKQENGQDVVNAARIVLGINEQMSSSYIKLKADTINLSGYVTATDLAATNAAINNLMSGQTVATYLNCGSFRCGAAQFTLGASAVWKSTIKDGDGNIVNVMKWG